MIDFIMISTRTPKQGIIEVFPKFIIKKSSDLMIRGGDFYAVWLEDKNIWSTDEQDVTRIIDSELNKYVALNKKELLERNAELNVKIRILHMWDADSGIIDKWHKYCQKQMRDNFHMLDEKIIFSNMVTKKKDYSSKTLDYALDYGDITAYEKLISTLYSKEERMKIEWAIGSIVCGDSKKIQKFMVLYGSAGTGKSTILNIIQKLFDGYYSVFDAKALGSSSNSFALESFKKNPLVAIQHDGDLSHIEDNTRLNSLVSHEYMSVNEKFKSTYANRYKCFLFMGTNRPVKISDAKSGLLRRLIDVSPSGNKVTKTEYDSLTKQIDFEYGAIAYHCQEVYLNNKNKYDNYVPTTMLGASNDFYNFVEDSYFVFKKDNGVTLKCAWEMYKTYCEDTKVPYPSSQRVFKEELKNYFFEFKERFELPEGSRVRNYYFGFIEDKFVSTEEVEVSKYEHTTIKFESRKSILDMECAELLAQYANDKGTPVNKWSNVKTTLSNIYTSKLHYVKLPENHVVIDFDITDETGEKNLNKNIEEASKWPPTYSELSKSGNGVHLHYIYTGDVSRLSSVYDEHIEIKVFVGNSSLRRKLTKCNDLPIAYINSGLPMKGENKMIDFTTIKSEKGLRTLIKRNLNKEIHPGTKPSVDFINTILNDAYRNGLNYDVTNMRNAVLGFAANSTHQADYCIKLISSMKFKSDDTTENINNSDAPLIFYDIEVFPNLLLICWKNKGAESPVMKMINPTPTEIEELIKFRLVGFNCRRYDNHILYARLMGYNEEQIYKLSKRIISHDKHAFFGEAYNISYTDIYDFASASNKKSLKKLEIEMGIHHEELGLPWDEEVPKKLWDKVASYCENDVIATEAAFGYLSADWTARQILADLAEMSVNDTTNTLTTKIIFNGNRKPQDQFNYRNLGEPVANMSKSSLGFLTKACPEMVAQPFIPCEFPSLGYESLLPYFPGYKYEFGKSTYRGELTGEGGYVYAEPGMYSNVALLDIASMHPNSAITEILFGVEYTKSFKDIVDGRVYIKHEEWNEVSNVLNGKLTKYVQKVIDGEMKSKDLATALKTAINSVYGLTSAKFDNPFRDDRNVDNIVAKRGALFMIDLKNAVQEQGYTVAHIKTDSIKIPDASPEIIKFVMDFGKRYGYTFEHEATYERMCIVNDAVYIAKYHTGEWTATGTQFKVPYVFKKLFSKEKIEFNDLCETNAVKEGTIYLDCNEKLTNVNLEEKEYSKLIKDKSDSESKQKRLNELKDTIDKGHNYVFIGRVGQFTPVIQGVNGGILYREKDNKYYALPGSKGYLWKESELIKTLNQESTINLEYYDSLVNDAIKTISKFGDVERFLSDEPYVRNITNGEDTKVRNDCLITDSLPESFEKIEGEKQI